MKLFRRKTEEEAVRQEIAVKEAAPFEGLTEAEAAARAAAGWDNRPVEPPTRTTGQIVRENLLTYFNLVFLVLALCLVAVKASILNLSFVIVVIINAVISIVQELRSKKALDALNILTAPQCAVVREGREKRVDVSSLVRDDIVLFSTGEQVCADAVVVDGTCLVNEALVTGEADEIRKAPGDTLLSGSFLVSGICRARLTAVGADSFVSRLTLDAKAQKKRQAKGMMKALNDLVKWIGIGIIPMGVLLVVKEVCWLGRSIPAGVTSTVGALVGMIPEGVYLLTSLALVAGVLRLAQKKTMCREMDCIETLARVDTLCVDKTGTVTENKMIVDDIVPLCPDRFIAEDIHMIMADYCAAMRGDNDTMAAMRKFFTGEVNQRAIAALPAALTDILLVGGVMLFYLAADLPDTAMSTICAGVMGVVGLMMVHQTAKPYNKLRIAMICVLALGFAGSFLFLKALFNLVALDFLSALVLAVFALLAWPVMNVRYKLLDKLSAFVQRRKKTHRAAKEL